MHHHLPSATVHRLAAGGLGCRSDRSTTCTCTDKVLSMDVIEVSYTAEIQCKVQACSMRKIAHLPKTANFKFPGVSSPFCLLPRHSYSPRRRVAERGGGTAPHNKPSERANENHQYSLLLRPPPNTAAGPPPLQLHRLCCPPAVDSRSHRPTFI